MDIVSLEKDLQHRIAHVDNDLDSIVDLVNMYVNLVASGNKMWVEKYSEEIKEIVKATNGDPNVTSSLLDIVSGFILFFSSKPEEAIEKLNAVLERIQSTDFSAILYGFCYLGLSSAYRSMGKIDKALDIAFRGIEIMKSDDEVKGWHVYIYRIVGEIHANIGEFEQAEGFYINAQNKMEQLGKDVVPTLLFRVYDGLGYCYFKIGDKLKSERYFQKALDVEGISIAEKSRVLCDFGVLYLDEPEKSLPFLKESCTLRKEHHLDDAYSTSLLNIAECFLRLENTQEAEQALLEAEPIIFKYNVVIKKTQFFRLKALYFEQTNDFKSANQYLQEYQQIQDTINVKQIKNIFNLKNNIIADQNKEIQEKNQRLRSTLEELAKIKVSRKAMLFSIITVVFLVIATEVFLDPLIEDYTGNNYLGLLSKIVIAFLLKPIDTMYERILFRKAFRD